MVDIGAGSGVITRALARRGMLVLAVEADPIWAERLRRLAWESPPGRIRVIQTDFLSWPLPTQRFRAIGSLPFGATTAILHRLLDRPEAALSRADLVVQWEVARKRAAVPPATLVSTAWAPWWELRLGRRIPADGFRPVPAVDAGTLMVSRREPPILPVAMASRYTAFIRGHWPFPG